MKSKLRTKVMLCVLTFVVMAIGLTACGSSKEPTDKDTFAKVLNDNSFKVVDQSSMIAEGSDFSVVYLAQPKTDGETTEKSDEESESTGLFSAQYQVEFYKFNNADKCEATYDKLDDELVSSYKESDGYKTTETDKGSYARRNVTTKSRYYVITRIDDTLIVAIAPQDNVKTIDTILEKLGY